MRLAGLAAAIAAALCCGGAAAQTAPAGALDDSSHRDIGNGLLSAKLYPPGANELYKGTRFDHAGVVQHITYKGQDFAQYWFDRFVTDPGDDADHGRGVERACCAVTGPVEEFEAVGFDDAEPGGAFLKIGVGILRRNTPQYDRFHTYPIQSQGKRTASIDPCGGRFTQEVSGGGYGYSYVKTVRLTPGKPQMIIGHVLTNTGGKSIVTTVYNHNFLTLSPGNAHVEITAPFSMTAENPLQPELAQLDGGTLRYLAPLTGGVTVSSPITGFGVTTADYDFRVRNTATGFGQRIRADQPMARIFLWSIHSVLGWEPYIAISLKPGESKRWSYTYDFYGPGEN